ncbi:hypothetical protein L6164_004986 [Bauhinia variegata]|uniref:Uncharacterized protein n=1 Tax=Bauhinia variegata TaxID=167791 RepID=A0ACB9PRT1_BAUVA|nr:hypothetical protein L6164_004986 [Bauhinia variegata]
MFNSGTLLSSKGPLGAIWVAAYCLKRLKKSQVKETDIPTSVDKILQDEINVVTYRVLAYLLLGVVRIYSKKVEYLFDDCNEVFSAIKKFVVNTKNNPHMETLRMHISLPDKFELDAFDLDILEDVAIGNIAPREEITLKDVFWKNEGIAQFSLDKYQSEEFETCPNTCNNDNPMAEDDDFNFSAPNISINSQTGREKSHNTLFLHEEAMDLDTDLVVEEEPTESDNVGFSQEQHINEEERTVPEAATHEDDEMYVRSIEKICRVYQEESVEISVLHGREQEPIVLNEPFNGSHSIDEEKIKATEMAMTENKMHQDIGAVHKASNSHASKEGLQDTYQEQFMDHDIFSTAEPNEHIDGSVEEHQNKAKLDFQGKVSVEDGNFQAIGSELVNVDETTEFKSPYASDARPKAGAATPDFMLIPTPAAMEPVRVSRERKCIWDENIVFTNKILKRWISNANDLICRRRKSPRNLSAVRRVSRISSLPEGFCESLLPCHSLELQSLFSETKMKISVSLENMETSGNLSEAEAQTAVWPEPMATSPETPPQSSTFRSFESPGSPQIGKSDTVRPSNTQERIEEEQALHKDEKLNLMKELNVRTSSSYGDHALEKGEELTLMNEDENSCETENQEMFGWSGRTRQVGRFLYKSFEGIKGKRELNFSQVLKGRNRKECAKLFYEILVLKSTSCVDVKQMKAYGDFSLSMLPKMDQTFGVSS